jgi:YHS domain-containing protein
MDRCPYNQELGGMTVKVATARLISHHLGQTHCSCSDGCKRSCEKEPEKDQEKVLTAWTRRSETGQKG